MQRDMANQTELGKDVAGSIIRVLDQFDAPRLAELEAQSFSQPWGLEQLRRALAQKPFRAFGLFEEQHMAAYCLVSVFDVEMEILNIAVESEQRRQGLGRRLMDFVLQWADKEGIDRVRLEVRPSNIAALALYAARGFQLLGLRSNYYRDTGEDALILGLDLQHNAEGS